MDRYSQPANRPTEGVGRNGGAGVAPLYQGTTQGFIGDATQARLAYLLADRFFDEFRYRPPESEVRAWQNSLGAMAGVLQHADLTDQGILVELKLPLSSKRLDVLLTGSNPYTRRDHAVVVELKQWTDVGRSNITDCVTVDLGGRPRDHLHPSRQVAQYQRYLQDTHPAFHGDDAIDLDACAYLHNAVHQPGSPIYDAAFASLLATNPAFAGSQRDALASFLDDRVAGPDDGTILERVATTAFRPHKRLLDHVARVIRNEPAFVLLDEQLVAYNAILDEVRAAGQNQRKVVFLVEGGPGTGKSVIAVNLVAELAERGLQTLHLTGSKAFTENLRKIVGSRAGALFKYFRDTASVTDPLDVAILDEAHRIRTISTSRFTPAKARTGKAQIDDILDASRVFFIDDLQVVRPGEVGSTSLIREAAGKRGIEVRDFKLEAQFRANGSDSFIQWVDNTLELARTPQVLWSMDDEFDFRIVGHVRELERLGAGMAIQVSSSRFLISVLPRMLTAPSLEDAIAYAEAESGRTVPILDAVETAFDPTRSTQDRCSAIDRLVDEQVALGRDQVLTLLASPDAQIGTYALGLVQDSDSPLELLGAASALETTHGTAFGRELALLRTILSPRT